MMLTSTETTTGAARRSLPTASRPRVERPNPEVPASSPRAQRRQFTATYKLRIVQEAEHTAIGQLGALLRREGLYSSHLTTWRRQRAEGALAGLAPQRRGRPPTPSHERELAQLREENARLARKLVVAETVIEVQKKVSALLGLALPDQDPPAAPPAAPSGALGTRTR